MFEPLKFYCTFLQNSTHWGNVTVIVLYPVATASPTMIGLMTLNVSGKYGIMSYCFRCFIHILDAHIAWLVISFWICCCYHFLVWHFSTIWLAYICILKLFQKYASANSFIEILACRIRSIVVDKWSLFPAFRLHYTTKVKYCSERFSWLILFCLWSIKLSVGAYFSSSINLSDCLDWFRHS